MAADANLITYADLARVQNVEFVNKFDGNINKLMQVLGILQPITMAPGTQLNIYKTSGTLKTAPVAEGDEIPLSKYSNVLASSPALTFGKYRKATSIEAIQKRGYDQAVTNTDNKMVRDIQKGIRTSIYTFLATGTGTATGTTFQIAIANAWAALQTKFEDDDATPVYFVNPLDIAGYLGTAAVTLQTAFGFSYIENFLGLGTVIVASDVPQKTVYATAQENLNLYNADLTGLDGFDMYSDETGYIAVAHDTVLKNGTLETIAYTGLGLFPEYLDRIVKATVAAA